MRVLASLPVPLTEFMEFMQGIEHTESRKVTKGTKVHRYRPFWAGGTSSAPDGAPFPSRGRNSLLLLNMLQSLCHQGQHMMVIQGIEGLLALLAELHQPGGAQHPQLMGDG